jgi:hypothetical protein
MLVQGRGTGHVSILKRTNEQNIFHFPIHQYSRSVRAGRRVSLVSTVGVDSDVKAATRHVKLVMAEFVRAYRNSGCSWSTTSWQCMGKHQKISPGFMQSQKNGRTFRR